VPDRRTFSSLSLEDIEKEIEVRKKLLAQMVGSLYPSLLNDEIAELEKHRWQTYQELQLRM
jgi:hypothetical protein